MRQGTPAPRKDAEARYIRITYLDHHDKLSGEFPNTFAFTTEVAAYRVK
jgi:hypothetical protein